MSDEYAARRRRQVVEAAVRCFARSGFQATSMDEVIAEAGVSAGTVYRWFRGKDELIAAVVAATLGQVGDALDDLVTRSSPIGLGEVVDALLAALPTAAAAPGGLDVSRVGVMAWAEALRNPPVYALLAPRYRQLHAKLVAVLGRPDLAARLPASDTDALAAVLFALAPGYLVQRLFLGVTDRDGFVNGVAALIGAGEVRRSGSGTTRGRVRPESA